MTEEASRGLRRPDTILSAADVAAHLGWSTPNHVHVYRLRTLDGTATVPFPEPDGSDEIRNRVNRTTERPWWYLRTIEAYAEAVRNCEVKSLRPETVAKMQLLWRTGKRAEEIAGELGIARSTVYRWFAKFRRDEA